MRYAHLKKEDFTEGGSTEIPADVLFGGNEENMMRRPRFGTDLPRTANPFWLFFATMLPWNYVT